MKKQFLMTTALSVGLALPAQADPTLGFGVSMTFGGGSVETGVGIRLVSDDEVENAVGTVGLDYMFQSQSWRPTVGVGYLFDNIYLGLDLGFDLNDGGFDVGVGVGGLNTMETVVTPAAEATTTPAATGTVTTTSPPTAPPTTGQPI